jgi:hypothetical protein
MKDHVCHLEVGQDDLVEEPRQVSDYTKKAPPPGRLGVTVKEQIMAEMGDQQAADHAKGHVKGVKHA